MVYGPSWDVEMKYSENDNIKYFNRTAQSDVMMFIVHTDKFVILH